LPLFTTSRHLDFTNELDGELWFDTCMDQVKSEEFKVNNTPRIRRLQPSWLGSTYDSSTKFEVEPLVKELKKTKRIMRSHSTSFASIEFSMFV
jgi:hypothetical protein